MGSHQRLVLTLGNPAGRPGVQPDVVEQDHVVRLFGEDALHVRGYVLDPDVLGGDPHVEVDLAAEQLAAFAW